jgi:hypothetical protein
MTIGGEKEMEIRKIGKVSVAVWKMSVKNWWAYIPNNFV